MDVRMYETLHSIPLFQGMSGIDLNMIFDRVQMEIEYLEKGDVLVRQGELCRQMVFLLSGTLQAETVSPDKTYIFREQIKCPAVLEADILYGIQRHWSGTYTSIDECRLMLLQKNDIGRMLNSLEIFRINYLNIVCSLASKRRLKAWKTPSPTLRERIVQFVTSHTLQSSGPAEMVIRMQDLGRHLGATRSLISAILHKMQDDGTLTLGRGCILIPDIANLH